MSKEEERERRQQHGEVQRLRWLPEEKKRVVEEVGGEQQEQLEPEEGMDNGRSNSLLVWDTLLLCWVAGRVGRRWHCCTDTDRKVVVRNVAVEVPRQYNTDEVGRRVVAEVPVDERSA